jgi:hypothetical protein
MSNLEIEKLVSLREGGKDWPTIHERFPKLSVEQLQQKFFREKHYKNYDAAMTALEKQKSA